MASQILLSVEELFEVEVNWMSARAFEMDGQERSEDWRSQVGGSYGKNSIVVCTKLRLIVIFAAALIIIFERV